MISIIIPTYNRLSAVKRCIESVIPQTIPGMEIIVIDDCSQDMTWNYLLQLAKEYDFIKVSVNPQNRGVNYTRNRGIEIASQKYILFLDSDDELYEGSIAEVVKALVANPAVKHFLFLVSDRAQEFAHVKQNKEITYEDWVSARVSGDFTHVVLSTVMKKYLFFEQFKMFEYLNWFRIKKETSPQILIPLITTKRERDRADSVTVGSTLRSLPAIKAKFEAEKFYYALYHEDLKLHYPRALNINLLMVIVLSVASNQKSDSKCMIGYANKNYIKLLGKLITFLPSSVVRYAVIKYSTSKAR